MSRLRSFLRNPRMVLATGLASAAAVGGAWLLGAGDGSPPPVEVPTGQAGSVAGVEWRLRELVAARALPSGDSLIEPAPGAVFVVARFDYRAEAGQEVLCRATLLGDGREWTAQFHSPGDPGFSAGCDGRPAGTAELVFEIPAEAAAEVAGLNVTSGRAAVRLAGRVQ